MGCEISITSPLVKSNYNYLETPSVVNSGTLTPTSSFVGTSTFLTFHQFMTLGDQAQIFEYRFEYSIGKGMRGGEVFLVTNVETQKKYAAKVFSKELLYQEVMEGRNKLIDIVNNEIVILSKFNSEFIVGLTEVIDDDTTQSFILIMQFADNGNMNKFISSSNKLNDELCKVYFYQMAKAIDTLHNNGVVHRDIKAENFLLIGDLRVVLSDFSESRVVDDQDLIADTVGTPIYLSPEVCSGQPYHAKCADIWALGMTMYQLVYDTLPFTEGIQNANYGSLLFQTSQRIQNETIQIPFKDGYSPDVFDLLSKMLDKDPTKRITSRELMNHEYIKSGCDIFEEKYAYLS